MMWARHLTKCVRDAALMRKMFGEPADRVVERAVAQTLITGVEPSKAEIDAMARAEMELDPA